MQRAGAVLSLSKCRPLFHELFLIAVHSHGHGVCLTRERACAVGSAQQSCLIRCLLRQYRSIEEEIRRLHQISRSFSPRAVARPSSSWWGRLFSSKLVENLLGFFFSLPRQWVKEGNKIGVQLWWCGVLGLILHFAGHSFNSTLLTVQSGDVKATLTDLNWCDCTGVCSFRTMSR